MKSENHMNETKKEFEDGEINIDQFMISGASSLAYALDMMY